MGCQKGLYPNQILTQMSYDRFIESCGNCSNLTYSNGIVSCKLVSDNPGTIPNTIDKESTR